MRPRQVVVQGQLRPAWMTPGRKEFPGVSRRTTEGKSHTEHVCQKEPFFGEGWGRGCLTAEVGIERK